MKISNRKSNLRWKMSLAGLLVILLPGFAWYSIQSSVKSADANITAMLIGEWKVQSSREAWMKEKMYAYGYTKQTDLTSYVLFKPDGTYESMSWDNAFTKKPFRSLEKGRYQISDHVITLRDFKMFSRSNRRDEGKDVEDTSKPCSDSLSCAVDWEVYNGYIQMAKEGVSRKIVRANWEKNYFVTEPIVEPKDGLLRSKQTSWIKQP